MLLKDYAISTFTGMAPIPVEAYAIKRYFLNDELFNLLEFDNIGFGTSIGNIAATYLVYDEPADAQTRSIGQEYTISNNAPIPVTVYLKMLGGAFQTDRVLERAFSTSKQAVSNWTEQQISNKINSIINTFAKLFIAGDSTRNPEEFDGMLKFFDANPGQVEETPLSVSGGISFENALQIETFLNEQIAKVNDRPSFVLTTRLKGKPFLRTLEQYRNRGITAITVNDKQYDSFMGIPIVGLSDSAFPAFMLANGIPFMFIRTDMVDGVKVLVPMNPGVGASGGIIDIVRPQFVGGGDNSSAGANTANGVFTKTGGVELVCCLGYPSPFAASLCYINTSATFTPVTAVEVSGPATIETDGGTATYTASVTPSNATNSFVEWSVTDGTGVATITSDGVLTAIADGTVTVTASATDGSGVVGTKEVTISNQD